jgi:hypothetical protein
MIYLIGEVSNGARKLADARERGMGRMFVDRLDEAAYTPLPGEPWALAIAADVARAGNPPLFVVIPDRPTDPNSILESLAWLDEWEHDGEQARLDPWGAAYGSRWGSLPLYLAVQNGMEPAALEALVDPEDDTPILAKLAGLFLGGDDDFKATVGVWRELADRWGLRLHYGRATQGRIRDAVLAGCDSGDSAHPNRLGPDRWARFLGVFEAETSQGVLLL